VNDAETISIQVNGEAREMAAPASVADLLRTLGLAEGRVAIERNREILPRDLWKSTMVAEGDRFEIVQFVGGG
jgi:thiamine biosynthesis protein ThiS